jgi:hypothetical protein
MVRFSTKKIFFLLHRAHAASYSVGTGVKRQVCEVNHSSLSSAEVKNACSYTSAPIRFHGVVLNYAQGNFTVLAEVRFQCRGCCESSACLIHWTCIDQVNDCQIMKTLLHELMS